MARAKIARSFFRRDADEKREDFFEGQEVECSDEDFRNWKAAGHLVEDDPPPASPNRKIAADK